MRNRSNSGVRLDYYQRLINKTILRFQNPVTGLFPASEQNSHAWVRDNVYSILAVWGLALAYRKTADLDEDLAKAYELEQSVVKLMRGLLQSMMLQVDKLEKFKVSQSPRDSLHAKYSSLTGKTVVNDSDWGHLQIDATSLYILFLAQMTASGLQIVYTVDEVAFIQNLVFYIETAYRTPAALEAINELDLFGARGGPASIIHALPDEAQQCQAILHSVLPRESISKEIDAALITIVSFPAFAVDDKEIIQKTRDEIEKKLLGNYGFRRFLRDGYKTAREDPNRLYYEPWELLAFEKIENQWPIFYAYFILDGLYSGDTERVEKYKALLDTVLLKTDDGIPMMPEMYMVPKDKVDQEIRKPNSQKRQQCGKALHMWGQSLYILGQLVDEKFISPGELDPLNRRLITEPRPDVVVQVVILAEDETIQNLLAEHSIIVQTISEVSPFSVYPACVLSQIYSLLGKNPKMGLTGRASSEIGLLATSKLYLLQGQLLAFIPQFVDQHQFYLPLDMDFLVDTMKNNIDSLLQSWRMMGRPTFICPINGAMLDQQQQAPSSLIGTIKKIQSGYIAGTRVHLGLLSDFVSTSCVTKLSFVPEQTDSTQADTKLLDMLGGMLQRSCPRPRLLSFGKKPSMLYSNSSVQSIVCQSRSITVDAEDLPEMKKALKTGKHPSAEGQLPGKGAYLEAHHPHLKGNRSPFMPSSPATSPCPSPSGSPKASHRLCAFTQDHLYENVTIHKLVEQLSQSETLQEQADIIHYLYIKMGPDWDTEVDGKSCTVRELLVELYEKAGHWKQWWLVRHTAGMLKKRVEDLALAVTDLLVRQKQVSVGLPSKREMTITSPLPPDELAAIIYDVCGEDLSTASLTQEILIYLAMFIRTEPKLFHEMLRLRVGMIIQVMATELGRLLNCSGEVASDHLLNLSPYQLKLILHHILSGNEFLVTTGSLYRISVVLQLCPTPYCLAAIVGRDTYFVTICTAQKHVLPVTVWRHLLCDHLNCTETVLAEFGDEHNMSVVTKHPKFETSEIAERFNKISTTQEIYLSTTSLPSSSSELIVDDMEDRQGQWLRRRRLDGALNRVPVGFYTSVWNVLEKCNGLSIANHFLPHSLTREMTPREFKFALQVERVLNMIPQPEYRQLMVEALMVTTLLVDTGSKLSLTGLVIHIDKIVRRANEIFIQEQKISDKVVKASTGAAGICQHLYDTAPSGRFGTMSYMARGLAFTIEMKDHQNLECTVG